MSRSDIVIEASPHDSKLIFSDPAWSSNATELESFRVTLKHDGLSASAKIYAYRPHDPVNLPDFFSEMAANWKGWQGIRTWETLEGEFKLSSSHDKLGHIAIEVALRLHSPAKWQVQTTIIIDAGQLEELASKVTDFFEPSVHN